MPHQCTNCGHVFDDGSKEMLSGCPDCGGNKFQYHPGDVPEEPPAEAEPPERESGSVTGAVGRAANKVRDAVAGETPLGAEPPNDEQQADSEPSGASASDVAAQSPTADSTDSTGSTGSTGSTHSTEGISDQASKPTDAPEAQDSSGTEPGEDAEVSVDAKPSDAEDSAQADARTSVVDRDVLPDTSEGRPDTSEGRVVKEPDDDEDRPDLEALRAELNDQFESIRIVAPGQYELNLMELYDRQEYIIALQEDGQYVIEVPDAWEMDDE